MDSLEREYRDLRFESHRYQDAQAEELLGHDPELLKLYYLRGQHYEMLQKLQHRLMCLTGGNNPLFGLALQVDRDQELAERARKFNDLDDVAEDVAALYEQIIEYLQSVVSALRQQVAELPAPNSDEVEQRLRAASSMASRLKDERYESRLSELQRKLLDRAKNTDASSQ